jgi:hypothetical protein
MLSLLVAFDRRELAALLVYVGRTLARAPRTLRSVARLG